MHISKRLSSATSLNLLTLVMMSSFAVGAQAEQGDLTEKVPAEHAEESGNNKQRLTVTYSNLDRNGNGGEFDADTLSLRLVDKLEADRSQYFILTGISSDFTSGATKSENDALSFAYGQIWNSENPGLYYNLGAFAGNGWIDSIGPNDSDNASNLGVMGGANKMIPLNTQSVLTVGSSFSVAYTYVDGEPDDGQGLSVTAYPYIQYNNIFTPYMMGYGRLGGIISSNDITMDGDNALLNPAVGFDFTIDDYTLGTQYTHELNSDHVGNIFTVSLSRTF